MPASEGPLVGTVFAHKPETFLHFVRVLIQTQVSTAASRRVDTTDVPELANQFFLHMTNESRPTLTPAQLF